MGFQEKSGWKALSLKSDDMNLILSTTEERTNFIKFFSDICIHIVTCMRVHTYSYTKVTHTHSHIPTPHIHKSYIHTYNNSKLQKMTRSEIAFFFICICCYAWWTKFISKILHGGVLRTSSYKLSFSIPMSQDLFACTQSLLQTK